MLRYHGSKISESPHLSYEDGHLDCRTMKVWASYRCAPGCYHVIHVMLALTFSIGTICFISRCFCFHTWFPVCATFRLQEEKNSTSFMIRNETQSLNSMNS